MDKNSKSITMLNAHEARVLAEQARFQKIVSDAQEYITTFYKELQKAIENGRTEVAIPVVLSPETLKPLSQFLRFLDHQQFECNTSPDSLFLQLDRNHDRPSQLTILVEF